MIVDPKLSLLAFEWLSESMDVSDASEKKSWLFPCWGGIEAEAPDHSVLGTFMIYTLYVIFS